MPAGLDGEAFYYLKNFVRILTIKQNQYIILSKANIGGAVQEERQRKILEIVGRDGKITIGQICSLFDVSEMTARRDLRMLDRRGLLRKVHGGAVSSLGRSYEPPFETRAIKHAELKRAIGRRAAELIYDGDSIALDVGTTTLEIVPGLVDKRNLTIVTNCLQVANAVVSTLSLEVDARLIITGGIVRPRELSMIGSIAQQVYEDLHVDKAFLGIAGISLSDGLTEYNLEDTFIKHILLRSAREKIVVADSTKFGHTTFAKVCDLNAIDKIVTDEFAPPNLVKEIERLGIEVILAEV